jgi:RNase H-fold protein (predicted Holliday junction resolvase)
MVQKNTQKNINKISTSAKKQDILKRINDLVNAKKYTIEKYAQLMQETKHTFYKRIRGECPLSIDWVEKFALIHNLDVNYFLCNDLLKDYASKEANITLAGENLHEYDTIDKLTQMLNVTLKQLKYNTLNPPPKLPDNS